MQRFQGQVVIVTGAAHGIGRGIATGFCAEGAIVNGLDIDTAGLAEVAGILSNTPGRFRSLIADVSKADDISRSVKAIREEFGRIDVLVNNAGINMNKRIADLDIREWDRVFDVNLKSVFAMCKQVWPVFVQQRAGVIVNISSVMGQVGGVGAPAYCSTKAGIIMLTRCLAKDGGPLGIRANSVCPGYIDTPILDRVLAEQPDPQAALRSILDRQPLGRLGTPQDIANGVMFLASAQAAFVSGIELTIDGALTATQID
jgi:meso-butanediol dehydrogenase / (S,S)-butanediol dehydrogenase / diacetyl reductase